MTQMDNTLQDVKEYYGQTLTSKGGLITEDFEANEVVLDFFDRFSI